MGKDPKSKRGHVIFLRSPRTPRPRLRHRPTVRRDLPQTGKMAGPAPGKRRGTTPAFFPPAAHSPGREQLAVGGRFHADPPPLSKFADGRRSPGGPLSRSCRGLLTRRGFQRVAAAGGLIVGMSRSGASASETLARTILSSTSKPPVQRMSFEDAPTNSR